MKKTAALIAVLLLSAPARAIELSLEENRGERGSVGYVDMQRLFSNSPDAQRAKENFEELVSQAEERVNLRKAELLKLHQELDGVRAERDALANAMAAAPAVSTATTPAVSTPTAPSSAAPAPASAVAVSTAAPKAPATAVAPPVVALSTASAKAPVVSTAAAVPPAVSLSTSAAMTRALALPGMSGMDLEPHAAPSAVAKSTAAAVPAVAVSSGPIPVVKSTAAAAASAMLFPAPETVPVVHAAPPAGPTQVQRLLEFDGRIISIQSDIAKKESELVHEHDDADKGLLDVENRKTDQVLARLYRAVSQVARQEGVSVVVDKTSILYGQSAVDLTDKVLKFLRENPQP